MQRIYQPPITSAIPPKTRRNECKAQSATSGFKNLLQAEIQELKLSKHAQVRLKERNIDLSRSTWDQINSKILEAKEKGIKDSLVLVDNAALVVNAQNKTVITAMNRNEAADHIFTNITGAILIN
ncbi:TIGR02530 family flagellar biosynthesis protein [Pseudalkalibacillus decolorationis]|uniref:TIGR02530 family flagellar biosynthesis protein n=1 Tax=Pseudalkalibacillus decolorationis TaxID=163879 RepID=UPI002148CA98|nr:TIGR02530 family flagellar biosynthesis protein [Pseudalkalibacillus decolorationis]